MTEAMKNVFSRPLDIGYMIRNAPPALDHVLPGLLAETVGLVVGVQLVRMVVLRMVICIVVRIHAVATVIVRCASHGSTS